MLSLEWLGDLNRRFGELTRVRPKRFVIGPGKLEIGLRPLIMGVINLSPQSWYRESVCLNQTGAVKRGLTLAAQGAQLIDLGGESTLDFADRISVATQIRELVPVVKRLVQEDLALSVECYSDQVAHAALDAGASIINMTGIQHSQAIYRLAAAHDAAVIVSYLQGPNVRSVADLTFKGNPIDAFQIYFREQVAVAGEVSLNKLILDPGLGYYYRNLEDSGERVRYQMECLLQSFRLKVDGFPVCNALPHAFEFFQEDVRSAEPFFAVLAALGKTDLFRTHEVAKIRAVLDTLECFRSQPGTKDE